MVGIKPVSGASLNPNTQKKHAFLWDLPTRLFHWGLAGSVSGALVCAFFEALLPWHVLLGKLALILVVFRLGWGWLGNPHARFQSFVRGPQVVWKTIRQLAAGKHPKSTEGHNPLAGWVMVSMLGLMILLGATGLMTLAGQENIGPWALTFQGIAPTAWVYGLPGLHGVLAWMLMGTIGLHLVGIALHRLHTGENPVKAMFNGGQSKGPQNASRPDALVLARRAFAISMGVFSLVVLLGIPFRYNTPETLRALKATYPEKPSSVAALTDWPLIFWFSDTAQAAENSAQTASITAQAETASTVKGEALWQTECGACHFAFPPNLLPGASWEKMLAQLPRHFGEDASLEAEEEAILRAYARLHGAERSSSEVAHLTLQGALPGSAPLQVTEQPFWKKRHGDIPDEVFQRKKVTNKNNCSACHKFALYGSFEDAHIRIP